MKNDQVTHGQYDSITFPKTFPFAISKPCWHQNSALLTGPRIYPQIYHRDTYPIVLICKGVWYLQRRGRIISNFRKGQPFFFFSDNQVYTLKGNFTMQTPSCTLLKRLSSLFTLAKKRIYLDTKLKEELTDLFWKLPGCSLFFQAE